MPDIENRHPQEEINNPISDYQNDWSSKYLRGAGRRQQEYEFLVKYLYRQRNKNSNEYRLLRLARQVLHELQNNEWRTAIHRSYRELNYVWCLGNEDEKERYAEERCSYWFIEMCLEQIVLGRPYVDLVRKHQEVIVDFGEPGSYGSLVDDMIDEIVDTLMRKRMKHIPSLATTQAQEQQLSD